MVERTSETTLQIARSEIPALRDELGLGGLPGAEFSSLFVLQLYVNQRERWLDPEDIVCEVRALQGLGRSLTKPAAPFKRAPLLGLWHKHFTTARHLPVNVGLHWKKPGHLERMLEEVFAGEEILTREVIGRLAERLVDGGHQERARAQQLTGQWIVYKPHEGVNYFLTLAAHTDADQAIFGRAGAAALLDFPHLVVVGERDGAAAR